MRFSFTSALRRTSCLSAALAVIAAGSAARASLSGFGDFSGFKINQNDSGSPPTIPSPGVIQLTNGGSQARSIFAMQRQNISSFTASFVYQATNDTRNSGVTFVIENDPRGASAVGQDYTNLGYLGITRSVGITLDLTNDATGLFTNGSVGSGEASISPVILAVNQPIRVDLQYTGSRLTETLTNLTTSASYSTTYLTLTPFATTVGDSSAYVGIAASGYFGATQYVSSFQFTSGAAVPEPGSTALALPLGFLALRRRR